MFAIVRKILDPVLRPFGNKKKEPELRMPKGLSKEQQKQLREIRERNTSNLVICQHPKSKVLR